MPRYDNEVSHPENVTVEDFHKPLLYTHDDRPIRRSIGFAMQTTGSFPQLTTKSKPKGKGKGGRCK